MPIKIASLIANEPEPALKEIATPVAVLEQNLLPVYLAGGARRGGPRRAGDDAGACGACAPGRGARPGPPPRPAHEIALERLDRLGAYGFLENADNRPFYFAVSEVIRDYLGGRYGFDSLELTTDELLRRAPTPCGARAGVLGEIEGWLSACDLVKFAKISPSAAEARGALESAIRIVEATRPRRPRRAPRRAPPRDRGAMPEMRQAAARSLARERPGAPASPTPLIAAVFAPLAIWLRARCSATSRGSGSRTPCALALIPPRSRWCSGWACGALPRGAALFTYSRAAELGAQRPGLVARLRDLPTVLRLAAVVLVGVALARPQIEPRHRRSRARGDRHRDRARSVRVDAGDRPRAQPARGGQGA